MNERSLHLFPLSALAALLTVSAFWRAEAAELDAALARLDRALVAATEAKLRGKLDAGAAPQFHGVIPGGDLTPGRPWVRTLEDGTRRVHMKYGHQAQKAAEYLIASEVLGERAYLDVGLRCCDFLLNAQQPRGYWLEQYYLSPEGKICGAPPGTAERPSHCRLQDGFQDENVFALVYAWRLSGERKYLDAAKRCAECVLSIQNENGTWPDYWDFPPAGEARPYGGDLPREQGPASGVLGVRLGCSYNDGATTRPTQMMALMYHLTGEQRYVARLGRLGDWVFATQLGQGKVRGWCQQYGLDGKPIGAREFEMPVIEPRTFDRFVFPLLLWLYLAGGEERHMQLIQETYDWLRSVEQKDGWAYQYLPDGAPVFSIGYKTYRYDQPATWPDGKNPYPYSRAKVVLDAVPPVLELYRQGGREALRRHFRRPAQCSPEQHAAARLDAARQAAATQAKDLGSRKAVLTFLYNVRLAEGKIPPESAAFGGYGLLTLDPGMNWKNRLHKVADWFDLPLRP